MSAILCRPPSTVLLNGQVTNSLFVSIRVTAMLESARRIWRAQVAPPKPPPTTTTCLPLPAARAPPDSSGASADAAPAAGAHLIKFLRVIWLMCAPLFQTADVLGQRRDLGIGIALGMAPHHGRRPFAAAEILERFHDKVGDRKSV